MCLAGCFSLLMPIAFLLLASISRIQPSVDYRNHDERQPHFAGQVRRVHIAELTDRENEENWWKIDGGASVFRVQKANLISLWSLSSSLFSSPFLFSLPSELFLLSRRKRKEEGGRGKIPIRSNVGPWNKLLDGILLWFTLLIFFLFLFAHWKLVIRLLTESVILLLLPPPIFVVFSPLLFSLSFSTIFLIISNFQEPCSSLRSLVLHFHFRHFPHTVMHLLLLLLFLISSVVYFDS